MITVKQFVARRARTIGGVAVAATGALALASCSHSSSSAMPGGGPSAKLDMSMTAPSPDPRVGLRGGEMDSTHKIFLKPAAEASWNLQHLSNSPSTTGFVGVTNSDLAFTGKYAIQGSYNGYQVWDISNPAKPALAVAFLCPASQSDVSVYNNLLFVSSESTSGRLDCGTEGVRDSVSTQRIRGVRIFDISDIAHPKYIANVQTCRGSHTHTVVTDPSDPNDVYIYISGTAQVRSPSEMPGCENAAPDEQTSLFNIEIIKVPLAHPEQAAIVNRAHIFENAETGALNGLAAPKSHGQSPADTTAEARAFRAAQAAGRGGRGNFAALAAVRLTPASNKADTARAMKTFDSLKAAGAIPATLTFAQVSGRGGRGANPGAGFLTQCHDITAYPSVGLAGGACAGMGLLLDIHDASSPKRIDAVSDSNFSFWHSATFSNAGDALLFSDEWGGGGQAYCRAQDPKDWGGDAIFRIVNDKLVFQSYYKMPAAQTQLENCVAHNGSLIPIPGRTVMVQSWYQGGVSVFDWTDPAHPHEIAFFDRGPNDAHEAVSGGFWSSYWYNGYIVASEILRGLDVFALQPSGWITQNEIDAARTVHVNFLNVQDQPKFVWPPSFALARAYLDQLERDKGMTPASIASARKSLASAETSSGQARHDALTQLATRLDGDAAQAGDQAKVHLLSTAVGDLANAS
jgi:hypothetical protein